MNEIAELKISELAVRVPYYKEGRGTVGYLSIREKVCIDEWCKSLSVNACVKALREGVGTVWGRDRVGRLLRRGRVQAIIRGRIRDRAMAEGISREGWLADGIRYQRDGTGGENKMSWVYWKEIGKAMGYYVEGDGMKLTQNFNLVQSDGKI